MMKYRVALTCLTLLGLISQLHAATYYVRKDGNDANAGTSDSAAGAWLTISRAAAVVKPGDVVYVRRGLYQEYVTLTRAGTENAPISWYGERDVTGNHLTIIDPSVPVSGTWTLAPEIGTHVYKCSFTSFTPAHLSADDYVVMQFKLYNNAYLDLGKPPDATVLNDQWSNPQPYWDGIEAGWFYTNSTIYIRFRDNSAPTSHRIKVSDNEGGMRFQINKAALLINTSFNRISGFQVQGTLFPVALLGTTTIKQVRGNTLEFSRVQQGFGQVILSGSNDRECEVSDNVLRFNILQHKGYWEKSGVTGGAVRYGETASWPNFQYYWATKNRWYGYTGSGFEHAHIVLYDVRDNNTIHDNTLTNGVHGIRFGSRQMWNNGITATGTTIASNEVSNISGALVISSYGHDRLYVHDNSIKNAWMGIGRLQSVNYNRVGDNRIYMYRNRLWNPPGRGQLGYFHLHNDVDTYQSEIWIYHNSYEGGNGGMTVSSWAANLPSVLGKVAFVNNIISTSGEPISSKYLTTATSLRGYDYNRSRTVASRPWVGGNNVVLDDYEWGGQAPAPDSCDWQLAVSSASVGSAVDVSKSFSLLGKTYPALPGFPSSTLLTSAINLGAVQTGSGLPKEPEEPLQAITVSLMAADALLLDTFMVLEGQSQLFGQQSTGQTAPVTYITTLQADRGFAHFHPTLPNAGHYTIWCRVLTRSEDADSFYVSFNGGTERVFETETWAPVWQWTRLGTYDPAQPGKIQLSHYLHGSVNEISFRGRDANAMLSRLLITNDPHFVPAEVAAERVALQIRKTNYGQVLKWKSNVGTAYRVLYSPEFKGVPWTIVGEPVIAGGSETEWLAPGTLNPRGYYWVSAGM